MLNLHLFEEVTNVTKGKSNIFYNHYDAANTPQITMIIATGFYDIPFLLNVPGEDLPKVRHYYKDPHFYAFQKVVVVGAMNSAVDAALETWRKGAEVTMVVRKESIGERVKYWVRPDIENRIAEGSIKAYFQFNNSAIRENEVDIQTPEGIVTIENDWVLALTGYQPNLLFLEKAGIELGNDAQRKPPLQRGNTRNQCAQLVPSRGYMRRHEHTSVCLLKTRGCMPKKYYFLLWQKKVINSSGHCFKPINQQ